MTKRIVTLTGILLIMLTIFLIAGRILVISQPLKKADVIIVLGGGTWERTVYASKLYKGNFSEYVILTNGGSRNHPSTRESEIEIKSLVKSGTPKEVIIPELKALSTYENAKYTKELLKEYNFSSAIIVTSSYHTRRAQYIFNKVYKESGIRLSYYAAPVEDFNPQLWWLSVNGWKYTLSEYTKLVWYIYKYR